MKARIILSAEDGYVYLDYSAQGDDPQRVIDSAVNGAYSALLKLALAAHETEEKT